MTPRILATMTLVTAVLTACGHETCETGPGIAAGDLATKDLEADVVETPPGDDVFAEGVVHTVSLTLAAGAWDAIIAEAAAYENTNPDRPYYPAQLTFDGAALSGDIGVRLKGHISIDLAEGHSFPLKLDFNRYVKGQKLDGLKKLNLNTDFDGPILPIMRDHLSYGAWRDFGVAASRTAFAAVTVNGEDLGIYVMVEQVDGGFLGRHFDEPRGDLYKPEQISGPLHYHGPHIADYPDIGHKWPDETDHAALLHALQVLDSGTVEEIEEVFDVEGVLTYLAGDVALGAGDYYPTTGHNYYLYEETPGRFTLLPWDMNGSQEPMFPPLCSPWEGHLSGRLLEDPVHAATYFDRVAEFLDGVGSAAALGARLDAAAALLGDAVSSQEIEDLRHEIDMRIDRLETGLAASATCPPPGD